MTVELVRTVPLAVTARESDAAVKTALDRQRTVTDQMITASCELARESRRSSESSSKRLKAVHPNKPLPQGDITERFEAIRAQIR